MIDYPTTQGNKIVVCEVVFRVVCPPRADFKIGWAESILDVID